MKLIVLSQDRTNLNFIQPSTLMTHLVLQTLRFPQEKELETLTENELST
jgi:hypothetical protein